MYVLVSSLVVSVGADSSTMWSQTYGGKYEEWATSVIATSDGGYAIVGYTRSSSAVNIDIWLVKTDSFGNMEWNRTYIESDSAWGWSVIETSDKGYAILGVVSRSDAGSLLLLKTDSSGNLEWKQTYSGLYSESDLILMLSDHSLVETSDGGYAISCYTNSSGVGGDDFLLLKTDSSGAIELQKTYGGTGDDRAYSLVKTTDGGFVIAGEINTLDVISGSGDIWLVKTDEFGEMEWNQTYERPPPEYIRFIVPAFSLVATADDGYAVAAATGVSGESDIWLIKTDDSGTVEWEQTYGGPDLDWVTSLAATSDEGYIMSGITHSSGAGEMDFWLVKTDKFGNMEWKKTYGGTSDDRAYSVAEGSDGGYVITGYTYSFGAGARDFWLVKSDGCVPVSELVTYEFDFSYGYGEYVVVISTNSTVGGFDFGINQDRVSFTVTGPTGTTGFARIVIPEDLTDGEFPVYLNEFMLMEGAEYTKTYNGTHTIIDMTYSHSTHMIEITGTTVLPEHSSLILTSLLLVAVLFIVVNRKKLFNQRL